jgi:hypothetical protein
MMDFEQRLQKAIQRGTQSRAQTDRADIEHKLSVEESRNLYSKARLELSEHIETSLKKLVDYFPGFDFSSIVDDTGWGARITRDDLMVRPGRVQESQYSRLEMTVTPRGTADIVEVSAKGTIRNRETIHRKHFQRLSQLDLAVFKDQLDAWILEYAEAFAAQG